MNEGQEAQEDTTMSLKRDAILTVAGVLYALTVFLLLTTDVHALPVVGPNHAIEAIAPGQVTVAGAISLDADTNADFLEWRGDGDGVTGDTDLLPIAHGARVTMKIRDATEATCCIAINPDQATTTAIGAQAANTTKFVVNGGTNGACISLVGAGDFDTIVINYLALKDEGMVPAGVCAAASVNETSSYYQVFGVCADDADCNTDGGHPASTTCDLSPDNDADGSGSDRATVNFTNRLPGVYVSCRALTATDVDYWVTR